jgi:hypothetical protein
MEGRRVRRHLWPTRLSPLHLLIRVVHLGSDGPERPYPFTWRFLKETLGFFDFAATVLDQIQNTKL